jgi:hypothetical protein
MNPFRAAPKSPQRASIRVGFGINRETHRNLYRPKPRRFQWRGCQLRNGRTGIGASLSDVFGVVRRFSRGGVCAFGSLLLQYDPRAARNINALLDDRGLRAGDVGRGNRHVGHVDAHGARLGIPAIVGD